MAAWGEMKGKLRLDLVPPELEEAFAQVGEFGVEKLTKNGVKKPDNNWLEGLALDGFHITKARRHINKWRKGQDLDEESNLNHLKHALWHLGAAITQIERGRIDLDDRKQQPTVKLSFYSSTPDSIDLTAEELDRFVATLQNPPKANENLKQLVEAEKINKKFALKNCAKHYEDRIRDQEKTLKLKQDWDESDGVIKYNNGVTFNTSHNSHNLNPGNQNPFIESKETKGHWKYSTERGWWKDEEADNIDLGGT